MKIEKRTWAKKRLIKKPPGSKNLTAFEFRTRSSSRGRPRARRAGDPAPGGRLGSPLQPPRTRSWK